MAQMEFNGVLNVFCDVYAKHEDPDSWPNILSMSLKLFLEKIIIGTGTQSQAHCSP